MDGINDNKSKDNDVSKDIEYIYDKFITTHCTCALLSFKNNESTSYGNVEFESLVKNYVSMIEYCNNNSLKTFFIIYNANVFLKRDTSTKQDSKDTIVQLYVIMYTY